MQIEQILAVIGFNIVQAGQCFSSPPEVPKSKPPVSEIPVPVDTVVGPGGSGP